MVEAPEIIILGGGGHGSVCLDMLSALRPSGSILGYMAPESPGYQTGLGGLPYLGTDEYLVTLDRDRIVLVNAIGSTGKGDSRAAAFEYGKSLGYRFMTLVHPRCIVASGVVLEEGVQVMAGAVIQPGTVIGANSIINTNATVDHDCVLGRHVHVSPGAVICGSVTVGDAVHIGAGAVIIQQKTIGRKALIGAGAVVVSDIGEEATAYGVPAKEVT